MICSILTAKYNNSPIDPMKLANKIKREIKDTNCPEAGYCVQAQGGRRIELKYL